MPIPIRALILSTGLFFVLPVASPAADQRRPEATAQEVGSLLDELEPGRGPSPTQLDLTEKQHEEVRAALVEHGIFLLRHRERLFLWQHRAAVIVFVVVHLLVLSGLVLSILQFAWTFRAPRTARHRRKARQSEATEPGPSEQVTEIELSPTSVKIRSAFIGLALLVVSMAFFYLYLHEVFPLKPLDERLPSVLSSEPPK